MGVSSWGHHSQPQFPLCKAGTTFLPQKAPDPTTWHTVGAQETAALEWRHLGKESDGRVGEVPRRAVAQGHYPVSIGGTLTVTQSAEGERNCWRLFVEKLHSGSIAHTKMGQLHFHNFLFCKMGLLMPPPPGALMDEMRKSKRRTYTELALSELYCYTAKESKSKGQTVIRLLLKVTSPGVAAPTIHLVSRPVHPGLPRGGHARGPQTPRPGDRFVEVWGWSV